MHVRRFIAVLSFTALAVSGCKKPEPTAGSGSAAAPGATAPAGAATGGATKSASVPIGTFDVPFKGSYHMTAKVAFRNGARTRTDSGKGTATLLIEPGKVTYHVEYPGRTAGTTFHTTEIYSFAQTDMHTVSDGTDTVLTFVSLDTDDKSWNPDSKDPKIEARKQAGGYEIGFLYRDTGGIQGGIEFH